MKNNSTKITIAAVIMIIAGMSQPGYCENNMALLVQQSPVQGGLVTPESGIHNFDSGMNVVITATPKPGYQFVYWIGDVDDAASNRTTVYLDSPKIIIAVFERSKFDFILEDELPQSQPGGGLIRSPGDSGNQGFSGTGPGWENRGFSIPENPEDKTKDFPVPPNGEDVPTPPNGDFPVPGENPVPEPATISLFLLGSLGVVRKWRELKGKTF